METAAVVSTSDLLNDNMEMNLTQIQELIKFVSKSGVSEVAIEQKDFKITIKAQETKSKIQEVIQVAVPQVAAPVAIPAAAAPAPRPGWPGRQTGEQQMRFSCSLAGW